MCQSSSAKLKIKLENNYEISNWVTSKVESVPKKNDIRLKTKKKRFGLIAFAT